MGAGASPQPPPPQTLQTFQTFQTKSLESLGAPPLPSPKLSKLSKQKVWTVWKLSKLYLLFFFGGGGGFKPNPPAPHHPPYVLKGQRPISFNTQKYENIFYKKKDRWFHIHTCTRGLFGRAKNFEKGADSSRGRGHSMHLGPPPRCLSAWCK